MTVPAARASWDILGPTLVEDGYEPLRMLALFTFTSVMGALFGGELLDLIGVAGIWLPFNIGVSQTQYVYVIAVPLVAILIVRTVRTLTLAPRARSIPLDVRSCYRQPASWRASAVP